MLRTGLVYDEAYLNHDTGFHKECARRLEVSIDLLKHSGMLEKLVMLKSRPASPEELGLVHVAR